ncbi:MAG TPA: sorbosone dehydrogenase family protein [Flavobacterium sp.]|jgi:glucose/arabinose dehydrogenase
MKNRYLLAVLVLPFLSAAQEKSTDLPSPGESHINFAKVIGWENGRKPTAPEGFTVTRYADGFDSPRWMYVLPNGDVLVAETNAKYPVLVQAGAVVSGAAKANNISRSPNKITLLRDADKDGKAEVRETFLDDQLNQHLGMLVIGKWLYVANTDALFRFPYKQGETKISGKGKKIVDLTTSSINMHWGKNIIANGDNSKIYISVGSATNIADKGMDEEIMRANILEVNPDGSGMRIFASGLRNPMGMDWAPGTKTLWTVVVERDFLGDELVPDYFTSVKESGFYGWPWSYFGQHIDKRVDNAKPEMVKSAIVPDVNMGAHTTCMGLKFYTGSSFPSKYRNGAFITQHGSYNRKKLAGYKVVFIPFKDGKPAGEPEDFLTGFVVDPDKDEVYGRPLGIVMMNDGSLLVSDDKTNTIWRISANR